MASDRSGSKAMFIAGWVLSVLPALGLGISAVMKLTRGKSVVEGFAHFGYPEYVMLPLGLVELSCAILFLIPRTAVLGAILLTGYMGGAVATHLRVGEPFFLQPLFGVVAWLGLYLRDKRVRELAPIRKL